MGCVMAKALVLFRITTDALRLPRGDEQSVNAMQQWFPHQRNGSSFSAIKRVHVEPMRKLRIKKSLAIFVASGMFSWKDQAGGTKMLRPFVL